MLRDLYLGFMRIHILHHASREPVYGLWLIEELNHHGYHVGPGPLYPTLHSLERGGLLSCQARVVEGRRRKYYTTTPAGEAALAAARDKLRELVDEVL